MLIMIKYGPDNVAERSKLEHARAGDEIVLIQNGVFWASTNEIDQYLKADIKAYALDDDCAARGYSEDALSMPMISYDGFIDIIERQEKSIS